MRGIVSLLTPKYQLLPEAKPRAIVGIEGSINLLFPEYLVNKCFIIPKEKLTTQVTQDEEKNHNTICVGHHYAQTNTYKT